VVVEPAAVDSGALPGGFVPRLTACQIARPEGPVPALARPKRINHTLLAPLNPYGTVGLPEKDAVFGQVMLDDAHPQAHALEVIALQLAHGDLQELGDQLNLRPSYPDIPLPRPRAAPPAPLTLKVQTANIPRISFLFSHRDHIPKGQEEHRDNYL